MIDLGEVSTSFTINPSAPVIYAMYLALAEVTDERDDGAVEDALDDLRTAIENDENVMPTIVDAVKVYATMGEIMGVFEDHHGSYQEALGLA